MHFIFFQVCQSKSKIMVAKSFLRGLMIGSLQLSLALYSAGIISFAFVWFLHTNGFDWILEDWIGPKMVPGAVPGTMVREKLTRSSLFSILLYIGLALHFFILTMRCCDFQGFLNYSMKGDVEKCGRNFCYTLIGFSLMLVLRIIYEMQINSGCYDYPPLINYLSLIMIFLPIIFNALFMISYGLFCMYFNHENYEITQVSA